MIRDVGLLWPIHAPLHHIDFIADLGRILRDPIDAKAQGGR